MTIRRIPNLVRTAALILVSAAAGSVLTGTASAQQSNMISARQSINQGIAALYKANDDKGGHRTQAINLAKQAVAQINMGIAYANGH